ncbi:hypothetical protein ACOMHN_057349 [Nucella lapillus]
MASKRNTCALDDDQLSELRAVFKSVEGSLSRSCDLGVRPDY